MGRKVSIQMFAILKENLGKEINLEIEDNTTSKKLLEYLAKLFPNQKEILLSSRVATDEEILDVDDLIEGNGTIGILPPSSGG